MTGSRSRATAVVLGVGLLLASCVSGSGSTFDAGLPTWSDVESTLERGLDPSSENVCVSDRNGCIDVVAAEMQARYEDLVASCHHDSAFALLYLLTTVEVGERVDSGGFADAAFLRHLDAVFADYYFEAHDAFRSGDLDAVPEAWQIAFESADERAIATIGNLLLGANAHIRRDLAFVMADIGAEAPDGTSRRDDYDRVNQVITDLVRPHMDEIADVLDPSLALFDLPLLDLDERSVGGLFAAWRNEAFDDAVRLLVAEDDAARAEVAADIERKAADNARLIRRVTAYPPLLPAAALRDRFCRAGA